MATKNLCKSLTILILFIGIVVSGCKFEEIDFISKILPDDGYVKIVKNGVMREYSDVKVGKAFDDFFENGTWHSFKTVDNQRVVEFSGKANWNDKPAKFKFQFIVDGNTFNLYAVSINDLEQNMFVNMMILNEILLQGNGKNNIYGQEVFKTLSNREDDINKLEDLIKQEPINSSELFVQGDLVIVRIGGNYQYLGAKYGEVAMRPIADLFNNQMTRARIAVQYANGEISKIDALQQFYQKKKQFAEALKKII